MDSEVKIIMDFDQEENELKQAYNVSRNTAEKADFATNLCKLLIKNRKYDAVIEFGREVTNFALKIRDVKLYYNTLQTIGNAYVRLSNPQQAKDYFYKALEKAEEMHDKPFISTIYQNIANVEIELQNLKVAFDMLSESVHIAELNGDNKVLVDCYNSSAVACMSIGKYDLGIEYLKKGLKLVKQQDRRATMNFNIGKAYYDNKAYDKAMDYTYSAYRYLVKVNEPEKLIRTCNLLASIHSALHQYDKAIMMCEQALTLASEQKFDHLAQLTIIAFAEIYLENNDFINAKTYLDKFLEVKNRVKNNVITQYFEEVRKIYKEKSGER